MSDTYAPGTVAHHLAQLAGTAEVQRDAWHDLYRRWKDRDAVARRQFTRVRLIELTAYWRGRAEAYNDAAIAASTVEAELDERVRTEVEARL